MKNLFKITIFLIFFVGTGIVLKAQDFTNAFEYLGYIEKRQEDITKATWNYIRTSAHSNWEGRVKRKKSKLIETIREAKNEIYQMPPFDGSTELRDSMVAYLKFSEKLLKGDYAQVEALEFEAKKSYEAMTKYLKKVEEINKKFSKHSEGLSEDIRQFATLHDIKIQETSSKTAAKIKISNIVNNYYNKLYLIYFRCAIANNFALQALNDEDTTKFKKWKDSLDVAVKIGNKKLFKYKGYNNDYSMKFTCQKSLNNYKLIHDNYFKKILNYYRAEANLEIAKKKYESKNKNKLTQEDVDQYNEAISNYNNAAEQYQQAVENTQNVLKNNQKQWNEVSDKFLDKHVPK